METWVSVTGAVVLALVVAVALGWYCWWKPKKTAEKEREKEKENHFRLFRCPLVSGQDAILAERVREQVLLDLSRQLAFAQHQLEEVEAERYVAPSVADLHYLDVVEQRRRVKEAEQNLQMAEFLERKFRSSVANSDSEKNTATGTDK